MNCQVVQNKILALPDPRLVPDSLRTHIASCAACQAWTSQAARLEGLIEQLPAPPAPGDMKTALVGKLERGEPLTTRPLATPAQPRESVLAFLQRNALVVGGLAAAIAIAIGAWVLFPRNGTKPEMVQTPDDPFLKKMVQRDLALANAKSPAERLLALSGMADDLSAQARNLARVAGADELRALAGWYDKVVKDAIVKQVERMDGRVLTPAEEKARAETLKTLADKLAATAAETDKLLVEVPPEAKPALQKIAETARGGQKKIELNEMRGKDK